jgi:hypothetical protein
MSRGRVLGSAGRETLATVGWVLALTDNALAFSVWSEIRSVDVSL